MKGVVPVLSASEFKVSPVCTSYWTQTAGGSQGPPPGGVVGAGGACVGVAVGASGCGVDVAVGAGTGVSVGAEGADVGVNVRVGMGVSEGMVVGVCVLVGGKLVGDAAL